MEGDPAVIIHEFANRIRWRLALVISRVGWWVMPEPQRSAAYKDFSEALNKIKARHGT